MTKRRKFLLLQVIKEEKEDTITILNVSVKVLIHPGYLEV